MEEANIPTTEEDLPIPTAVAEATSPALKRKDELQGTVKRIEMFGAVVDIGMDQPGLLHLSQIPHDAGQRIEDILQPGQPITVWVKKVDAERGRVDLTMEKPLALDWRDIQVGQIYSGKVVRVEQYGAFVDIGAERPGLVHIRELSTEYIRSAAFATQVDEIMQVKVLGVDRKKRQIDLSAKAVFEEQRAVEAIENVVPADMSVASDITTMEIALRSAMAKNKNKGKNKNARRMEDDVQPVRRASARELEDIFNRTLAQHR